MKRRRTLPVAQSAIVRCERLHVTLSASVCALRFERSDVLDKASVWNGVRGPYAACVRCEVGQANLAAREAAVCES